MMKGWVSSSENGGTPLSLGTCWFLLSKIPSFVGWMMNRASPILGNPQRSLLWFHPWNNLEKMTSSDRLSMVIHPISWETLRRQSSQSYDKTKFAPSRWQISRWFNLKSNDRILHNCVFSQKFEKKRPKDISSNLDREKKLNISEPAIPIFLSCQSVIPALLMLVFSL